MSVRVVVYSATTYDGRDLTVDLEHDVTILCGDELTGKIVRTVVSNMTSSFIRTLTISLSDFISNLIWNKPDFNTEELDMSYFDLRTIYMAAHVNNQSYPVYLKKIIVENMTKNQVLEVFNTTHLQLRKMDTSKSTKDQINSIFNNIICQSIHGMSVADLETKLTKLQQPITNTMIEYTFHTIDGTVVKIPISDDLLKKVGMPYLKEYILSFNYSALAIRADYEMNKVNDIILQHRTLYNEEEARMLLNETIMNLRIADGQYCNFSIPTALVNRLAYSLGDDNAYAKISTLAATINVTKTFVTTAEREAYLTSTLENKLCVSAYGRSNTDIRRHSPELLVKYSSEEVNNVTEEPPAILSTFVEVPKTVPFKAKSKDGHEYTVHINRFYTYFIEFIQNEITTTVAPLNSWDVKGNTQEEKETSLSALLNKKFSSQALNAGRVLMKNYLVDDFISHPDVVESNTCPICSVHASDDEPDFMCECGTVFHHKCFINELKSNGIYTKELASLSVIDLSNTITFNGMLLAEYRKACPVCSGKLVPEKALVSYIIANSSLAIDAAINSLKTAVLADQAIYHASDIVIRDSFFDSKTNELQMYKTIVGKQADKIKELEETIFKFTGG